MNRLEREIVNEDFIKRDDTYNICIGGTGGWERLNKKINEDEEIRKKRNIKIKEILKAFFENMKEIERSAYFKTIVEKSREKFKINRISFQRKTSYH